MQWPGEIVAAFEAALVIEPEEGYTPAQVLRTLLDETMRRAVWRAECDPQRLVPALRSPYTPLGSLVASTLGGRLRSIRLDGTKWGRAVDLYNTFAAQHADDLCAIFRDEAEPYDDLSRRTR